MKTFPAVETLVDVSGLSPACLANLKELYEAITNLPDNDNIEITVDLADPSGNNKTAVEIKLKQPGSVTHPSFSESELSLMCFSYINDFPVSLRFSTDVSHITLKTIATLDSAPLSAISNILTAKLISGSWKAVNANIHGYTPPGPDAKSNISAILMLLDGSEGISLQTTVFA